MRRRNAANRSGPAREEPDGQHQSTDDVEFIIGETSEWIRNADTKTGLLFAGLAILLGAVSDHAHDLRALWTAHESRPAAIWILGAATILLAASFALLVLVLVPRTTTSGQTRYAWPWVANATPTELEQMGTDTLRSEAWRQAHQLAKIAAFKYRYFTRAVVTSGLSVTCLLIWSVLRP